MSSFYLRLVIVIKVEMRYYEFSSLLASNSEGLWLFRPPIWGGNIKSISPLWEGFMSWVEMVKKGSTVPDLHHPNLVRVVCYWATLTLFSKRKQT